MYNTLTDLMTGICDAVREKEGSSDLIPVQELPERIRGISGIKSSAKSIPHIEASSIITSATVEEV